MKVLVLWDVDHTLIENGGISKATYVRAYEALCGAPPGVGPETGGRTDGAIMRNLFEANAREWEVEDARLIEVLTEAMAANEKRLRERGYALPGARETLALLAEDRSVVQSVLTGNIKANARVKLGAFGLDGFLDLEIGGYGSDALIRARLVAVAQDRARQRHGQAFDEISTVLVGDTVRDVEAGRDGGALVLAVASGEDDEDTLWSAGADMVLCDLTDSLQVLGEIHRLVDRAALPR